VPSAGLVTTAKIECRFPLPPVSVAVHSERRGGGETSRSRGALGLGHDVLVAGPHDIGARSERLVSLSVTLFPATLERSEVAHRGRLSFRRYPALSSGASSAFPSSHLPGWAALSWVIPGLSRSSLLSASRTAVEDEVSLKRGRRAERRCVMVVGVAFSARFWAGC